MSLCVYTFEFNLDQADPFWSQRSVFLSQLVGERTMSLEFILLLCFFIVDIVAHLKIICHFLLAPKRALYVIMPYYISSSGKPLFQILIFIESESGKCSS